MLHSTQSFVGSALILACVLPAAGQDAPAWGVHDTNRPLPPRVDVAERPLVPAPADALVLFDGTDLSAWRHADGSPAKWTVRDGYFEVARGTGPVFTKPNFGDLQFHIEWMVPESEAGDEGQGRGNSGLFFMNQYEIQILESTGSTTYADGMAGALYGQYPPVVNAGAGLGRWNTYDIIFRAPEFDGERVVRPARITAVHNGVVIHDHVAFNGRTRHRQSGDYVPHAAEMPIQLQDHGDPVRFRNIWARRLAPTGPDAGTWIDLFRANADGTPGAYAVAFRDDAEDADASVAVVNNEVRVLHDWDTDMPSPFGYIYTADAYSSYDLEFEYRWGERRFAPRADKPRNSGLLLHVRRPGPVWPPCMEFQVQEGVVADAWAMVGVKARVAGTDTVLNADSSDGFARSVRWANHEHDGWNRARAEVRGDRMWFYVNGRLVQELTELRDADGPLDRGVIGFQIEAAEVTYRNVRLLPR